MRFDSSFGLGVGFGLIVAAVAAITYRLCQGPASKRRFILMPEIKIPAGTKVKLAASAKITDEFGNPKGDANIENLSYAVESSTPEGAFQIVEDEDEPGEFDLQAPTEAGSTAELVATADVDGVPSTGRLTVTIEAGVENVTVLSVDLVPDED